MRDDFVLALPTTEVADAVEIISIKRELYHATPWLSDYCKDEKLLSRENLSENTERIIHYFVRVLRDENVDIHDFAGVSLEKVTDYDIRLRFKGYRD